MFRLRVTPRDKIEITGARKEITMDELRFPSSRDRFDLIEAWLH